MANGCNSGEVERNGTGRIETDKTAHIMSLKYIPTIPNVDKEHSERWDNGNASPMIQQVSVTIGLRSATGFHHELKPRSRVILFVWWHLHGAIHSRQESDWYEKYVLDL